MARVLPSFTPAERIALDMIREERPGVLVVLRDRVDPVLAELVMSCQGLLASEIEGTTSIGFGANSWLG